LLEARRVLGQWRLTQRHRAHHQVDRRRDVVPPSAGEGRARGDERRTDQERQRARLVEHQGEAGAAILRPRAHDDLPPRRRPDRHPGGLDESLKGEACESGERLGLLDDRIRAGVGQLGRACMLALDRRRNADGLEAGTGGAGVATDQADDLRAIAPGTAEGADHESDRLARRDGERVRVAEHPRHRHAHGIGRPLTRDRARPTSGR
jgi:hypothetical protein